MHPSKHTCVGNCIRSGHTLSQKYRDFPKYATECSLEVVIWNGMVRGFFPNYVAGGFKVPLIVPHYC